MKHIELLNEIKEKGGLKIVTVMIGDENKVFYIDEDFEDDFTILKWFKRGMATEAGIAIRQVLEEDRFLVAGVHLQRNTYTILSAAEVEWAFTTDSKTGKPIPKAKSDTFVYFDELLESWEFEDGPSDIENFSVHSKYVVFYNKEENGIQLDGSFAYEYNNKAYKGTFFFILHEEEVEEESENEELNVGGSFIFTSQFNIEDKFLNDMVDEEELDHSLIGIGMSLEDYLLPESELMQVMFAAYYKHYGVRHNDDPKG